MTGLGTVSQFFGLGKSQGELDFVDVPVDGDLPLFVDPFAISVREDPWSVDCASRIQRFFQLLVDRIRTDKSAAMRLLGQLGEPNETRLGLSKGRPRGSGFGPEHAEKLYVALSGSEAVKSGFVSRVEETELMIPGIGRDRISDLTTNVLRERLVEYTKNQCALHEIPTSMQALPPIFDFDREQWVSSYFELPATRRGPLLLVPKAIVRFDLAYDHYSYYRQFVIEYLRAEELKAGSSLVHVLKNDSRVVRVKDVKAKFPLSKDFLAKFSKDHPGILERYRRQLEEAERSGVPPVVDRDEKLLARSLVEMLRSIPAGPHSASAYHRLIIGIIEFVFFPQLLNPMREKEIHDGRKRIDILYENGAHLGQALFDLHSIKKTPCAYVSVECKNYSTDIANPELDQLAGRFSEKRGRFGLLCCRTFDDRALFIKRCRDTFVEGRGLIVPIDDDAFVRMLELIADGKRSLIDGEIRGYISEVHV